MCRLIIVHLFCFIFCKHSFSQTGERINQAVNDSIAQYFRYNPDTSVVTTHETVINGKQIIYNATAGTLPVVNEFGKKVAGVFYTYYERTGLKDRSMRPVIFFFNGGPSSCSVLLHLGYAGPQVTNLDDEGYPVQPFGTHTNEYSVLDVADLVFVDPVETGYSRILDKYTPNDMRFFSSKGEANYLSKWIETFLNRHNRWSSPKYLVGESYGAVRVADLSERLSEDYGIYVNGVVLVSSAISVEKSIDNEIKCALNLSDFTRIAWENKLLHQGLQEKDADSVIRDAKRFSVYTLLPALIKIGFLNDAQRLKLADSISWYTSIPANIVLQKNLQIDSAAFVHSVSQNGIMSGAQVSMGKADPTVPHVVVHEALDASYYMAITRFYNLFEGVKKYQPASEWINEAESFIVNDLIPAAFSGNLLSEAKKEQLVIRLAHFTGLCQNDAEVYLQSIFAGNFSTSFFWQKLFSGKELYLGGLDGRYRSLYPGLNPTDAAINQSFTPAINSYLQNNLKYKSDLNYVITKSFVTYYPFSNNWTFNTFGESAQSLQRAMASNPFMQILFQTGIYDPSNSNLSKMMQMWQLDPGGKLKDRIHFKLYNAGHMMYVRRQDRKAVNDDLRLFILNSIPKKGYSARY